MTTVVVVDEAEHQLREIDEWWTTNRPASPDLFAEEFARCVMLLEHTPDIGARFSRTPVPGVRRLQMKKTRHVVYYIHDSIHEVVYIIAIWGGPKGSTPSLRDPR